MRKRNADTRKEIDFNKIYKSKIYGPFKILNEEPYIRTRANNTIQHRIRMRFLNTGTERIVNMNQAIKGSAMDPYARTVHGVGYWGEIKELALSVQIILRENMIYGCILCKQR